MCKRGLFKRRHHGGSALSVRISQVAPCVLLVIALTSTISVTSVIAQRPETTPALVSSEPSVAKANPWAQPLASVNGEPISVGEIYYFLPKHLRKESWDAIPPVSRQRGLEVAVNRRLVLAALERRREDHESLALDKELMSLTSRMQANGSSFEQFLSERRLTREAHRHILHWQLAWDRYLAQSLTDANLERYFTQHRREFDGTRLHVAHILWKVAAAPRTKTTGNGDVGESPATGTTSGETGDAVVLTVEQAREIASDVRRQIELGTITFEQAAARHSASITRDQGGELGWIERHGPMGEAFTVAAFQLQPQGISPPIVTPAGVHLIRCLEVNAGESDWQEVRAELEQAVQVYLFQWLADRERPLATIQWPNNIEPSAALGGSQ